MTKDPESIIDLLVIAAKKARSKAYAPYSQFTVGAAVLTMDDTIFEGCNVENSSFGLTNCAERTALFNAYTHGYRRFKAMAIIGPFDQIYPCGACRQVIWELAGDIPIFLLDEHGDMTPISMKKLLPYAFEAKDLHRVKEKRKKKKKNKCPDTIGFISFYVDYLLPA